MKSSRRKPWIAVLLSIICPGLGHVYSGNLIKGVSLNVIPVLITFLLVYVLFLSKGSVYILVSGGILVIGVIIWIHIDAYKTARSKEEDYQLRRFNKWYVYLLFFFIFWIIDQIPTGILGNSFDSFKIPSGAMLPTILVGDYIMVDKTIDPISDLKLNQIIVFKFPKDTNISYIKRVVGLPGDTIELKDKNLYRNGAQADDPYAHFSSTVILPKQVTPKDNFGPVTVPEKAVFVMGDNRDNSSDSRFWGFVPFDLIQGRVISIYWSWDLDTHEVRWNRIGQAFN